MSLKKKIQDEINQAIKEKKDIETLVLRQLSAAILNKEKEKRYKLSKGRPDILEKDLEKESQLTDEEVIQVIASEAKKRKEAIEEYEKGEREDLVQKEKQELEILEKYLPEQLSEEEIKKLAKEAIEKVEASEPKDMGKVMAELMPKVQGRTEGGTVNKIVKELLSPPKENKA